MTILKGRYYKSLYEEAQKDYDQLLSTYKICINQAEKTVKKYNEYITEKNAYIKKLQQALEKQNKDLIKTLTFYENKLKEKENARRKSAGKSGGLIAKNNKMQQEKQQMLDLINRLLVEIRKLSKEKKKPTLTELKKYFKVQF